MRNYLSKFLFGDDIFISYSRADGATYATALANTLAGHGLSCRFDQWGTVPGREVPDEVLRALRRSGMLVVVATPEACRSSAVDQEIREFLPTKRLIVPVDLSGDVFSARWWPLLEGLPVSQEHGSGSSGALNLVRDGSVETKLLEPSLEAVSRIENSIAFVRKDRRLRHASAFALVLLLLSMSGALVGAAIARIKGAEAIKNAAAAQDAEGNAARANGVADQAEARRASAELQERHASGIARAQNALTAQNPSKALELIEESLKIEKNQSGVTFSPQSRILAAQSINQGVPRQYHFFSRVGEVGLSPSGEYIAALGSTASSLDQIQLDVWSSDGKHHNSLRGRWGPIAFSPDGRTLAVTKVEVDRKSRSHPFQIFVQWYSYDLRLIKQVVLDPVPIAAKPGEASPLIFDSVQNPLPFDLRGELSTPIGSAAYVYDVQEIKFNADGTRLVIAGTATINPRILIPRSYRASIDVASPKVTAILDIQNDLTLKTDTNRESVEFLGSSQSAAFASNNELHLFEMTHGKDERIGQHPTEIRDFAASPSGTRIVVAGVDNKISLFERRNELWQRRVIDLTGDRGCSRVIFIGEDYIAAAREDFTLTLAYVGNDTSRKKYLVDTSVGRIDNPEFATLTGPASRISSLVVSSDKRWLAAGGSDRVVYVWDLRANDRRALQGNERGVTGVAFARDSQRIVTGGLDGAVRLWDLNWNGRRTMPANPDRNDVQFYLDENMSDRGEILDTGWTQESLRQNLGFVRKAELSRDGKYILSETYDHKVSLWNTDLNHLQTFDASYQAGADISLDSKWIMIGRNRVETGLGKVISRQGLDLHGISGSKTISIDGALSPNENLFSPNGEWAEIHTGSLVLHKIVKGIDPKRIARGIFSADGKWFAIPGPKDIQVWDTRQPDRKGVRVSLSSRRLSGEDDEPDNFSPNDVWIGFSPDGKLLGVSILDHGIGAIDLITLATLEHHTLRGRGIHGPYVFSPDSKWLAGTGGGVEVYLWPISNGQPRILGEHSELVNAISFSPDSKWIASGGNDNTTRIWSIETSDVYEIHELAPTRSVAFLNNGRVLLQATGNGIQSWFSPSAPLEEIFHFINDVRSQQ